MIDHKATRENILKNMEADLKVWKDKFTKVYADLKPKFDEESKLRERKD